MLLPNYFIMDSCTHPHTSTHTHTHTSHPHTPHTSHTHLSVDVYPVGGLGIIITLLEPQLEVVTQDRLMRISQADETRGL